MGNVLAEAVERASGYPTVLVCVVSAGDIKCEEAVRALRGVLPGWAIFHVIECGSMLDKPFIQDILTAHIADEGQACGDIYAYTVVVRESAHAASSRDIEEWWGRAGCVAWCVKCFIYTPPAHGSLWKLIEDDVRAQEAAMRDNQTRISPFAAYINPHVSYHKRVAGRTGRPFGR
jgi:hypothetical protein